MGKLVVNRGEEQSSLEFPTIHQFLASNIALVLTDKQRLSLDQLASLSSFRDIDWSVNVSEEHTCILTLFSTNSVRATTIGIDTDGVVAITSAGPPTVPTLDIAALVLRVHVTGVSY